MNNDEFNLDLKAFEKIISNIKKAFTEEDKQEGMDLIVKTLAVAIFTDRIIRKEEIKELRKLISNIVEQDMLFEEKDKALLESLVKVKLNDYKAHAWKLQKDSTEIVKYIIDNGEWVLAEYIIKIYKSDGILTDEEKAIVNALNTILDAKKVAYRLLDL